MPQLFPVILSNRSTALRLFSTANIVESISPESKVSRSILEVFAASYITARICGCPTIVKDLRPIIYSTNAFFNSGSIRLIINQKWNYVNLLKRAGAFALCLPISALWSGVFACAALESSEFFNSF